MIDSNILIAGIPAVGLVMALCQIVKGYIGSKWAPLVSLALGVAIVALAKQAFSIEIVMMGLAVGLSAAGAFSGAKRVIQK